MKLISFEELPAGAGVLALVAFLFSCGRGTPPNVPRQPTPPPPPEVIRLVVNGLVIDGILFPIAQFHEAPPDRCDAPHWHTHAQSVGGLGPIDSQNVVQCPTDGRFFPIRNDPDPAGCGFGRLSEVTRKDALVDRRCFELFDQLF